MGSEHFARHPTVPLTSVDLMVCMDLVGHALGPAGLPEEVRQLGSEEAILFKEGARAVRGKKLRYYRDRAFAARQGPSTPVGRLPIEAQG